MKPKITINAPVMLVFVGLSLLAFMGAYRTNGMLTDQFLSIYGKADLNNPYTYIRLIGHIFGYTTRSELREAMLLLLVIGPMVEDKYGSGKMFGVIVAVAVVTGIVHYIFFPDVTLMGANGIIYALIIMGSFTGDNDGSIPITFIIVALVYLYFQLQRGYSSQSNVTVAYVVESILGGMLGGIFTFKK